MTRWEVRGAFRNPNGIWRLERVDGLHGFRNDGQKREMNGFSLTSLAVLRDQAAHRLIDSIVRVQKLAAVCTRLQQNPPPTTEVRGSDEGGRQ